MLEISIVIPCYNEELRFSKEYWYSAIENFTHIQWYFANDGSTDGTINKLKELLLFENCSLIEYKNNHGKAECIRRSIKSILSKDNSINVIGYIDCDGAITIEDMNSLITEIQLHWEDQNNLNSSYDSIIASRASLAGRNIERNLSRHYIARIISTFLCRGWNGAPYDTQCGFKLFRVQDALNYAVAFPFKTRWFIDIELFSRISLYKLRLASIWEVPLMRWRDIQGSKLTNFGNFFRILKEIIIARGLIKAMLKVE